MNGWWPVTSFARYLALLLFAGLVVLASPDEVRAYSALTHEAIVDSAWDDSIRPLLQKKYAGATEGELRRAHAYAYGGCILQDMGYYPLGNRFLTDLLHYVRSGDFAAALIAEAEPIDEYAFALGALEHYLADQTGHSQATNVVVPMEFPKLRRKYDSWVTYEDDPVAHLQVEFGFDVLQVAAGHYTPSADHDFIGFQVAKDLLDRTFYRVYGLKVSDLLPNEELAIGTYRRTVSVIIPEATRIAWEMKKDALERALPGIEQEQFVYMISRQTYESEWGNQYMHPSGFDTMLAFVFRLLPEFGPLKFLDVKALTAQSEQLFTRSLSISLARYREALTDLSQQHTPPLPNIILDTGAPAHAGAYALADDTHAQLVHRLRDHYFADVNPALRDSILAYYERAGAPLAGRGDTESSRALRSDLSALRAAGAPPINEDSSARAAAAR